MISARERNNFLTRCWTTGRWSEGAAALLLPVRLPVYRFRKALSQRNSAPSYPAKAAIARPNLDDAVHAPFCSGLPLAARVDGLDELFGEVKAQAGGEYRLAGARRIRVDQAALVELGDQEDQHCYHRLYWAVRYSRGAAYGYPGAAVAYTRDLRRWMDADWSEDPVAQWPYTLAERIASLAECLVWRPSIEVAGIKQQIFRDATRLTTSIEYALGVHNHLLNDARGLYIASAALPEALLAQQWRTLAFGIWERFFPQLVLEDGTFAEQSSHYHLLLCRTALEYWIAARICGRALPAAFEPRLREMFALGNDLLRPDGTLPRFGDISPDHTIEDLWGLMAAASHFQLLERAPRHRAITPLTVYYCGSSRDNVLAICGNSRTTAPLGRRSEPLAEPRPEGAVLVLAAPVAREIRIYRSGGFAMLRSGGAELTAHGDPRPESAPHGDAGRGSFELWRENEVLIREPGSLWSSDPTRRFYRTGAAQNVTCVNGIAPGITSEDRGYLPAWYPAQTGAWRLLNRGMEFRWDGFQRIQADIVCTRRWQWDAVGDLTFEEDLEGSRSIEFESRLCLGESPWGALRWDRDSGRGELQHPKVRMAIEAPPDTLACIDPCTFLKEYGVEHEGKVLCLSAKVRLPFTWRLRWSFQGK